MNTKKAADLKAGDIISRFGWPVTVINTKRELHPQVRADVVTVTYQHDTAGIVSLSFHPWADVPLF